MRPNKAETAVHGCHCLGDMAVRMRKVLARPCVGVWVCHLLLLSLVQQARFWNSAKLNDNIMLQYPKKTVMYQNCKSQQYYNFWTTKYLIITLFYSFPSKEQNCVLSTMKKKKTFPMLCTQSPCVHSYHFAPGMCLSIIAPYYMNIHWMYCTMTKWKKIFGHINITGSKYFFINNSFFLQK